MQIRNFVIISHVDHGKSTLADRLLEVTGTVSKEKLVPQFLDRMPLERERGITIKMQPVRMVWKPNHAEITNHKSQIPNKSQITNSNERNNRLGFGAWDLVLADSKQEFVLNLIDTPGHSDFSYEVSRGLAAVEGAVLLVDATKGVQAQTLANFHLAERQGLTIIPAINKIDLPTARIEECAEQFREILGIGENDILHISGKTGIGVDALLERIVGRVPPPAGDPDAPLKALIFDSHFDVHKGIIAYVRVFSGILKTRDVVRFFHAKSEAKVGEVGVFRPNMTQVETLEPGEIGYIATGLKDASLVRVGDTVTNPALSIEHSALKNVEPLPGYKEPQPLVFASFYPASEEGFPILKVSLEKLHLNDAAFTFEEESAETLGRGFRCGFLGTLHQEIVEERLKREYGQEVIVTQPSVALEVVDTLGKTYSLYRPRGFDRAKMREVREPWLKLTIFLPPHLLSQLIRILPNYRAYSTETKTLGVQTVSIEIEIPLAEFFTDFAETLQSAVSGYASFSYEPIGMRAGDLVRFEILVHGEPQEAFSQVVHRIRAERIARDRVEKLKAYMPKQLFPVALQATIDGAIVARETIPAMRKDVTGYLYGGDVTRKKKLLAKQKRGKKLLAEKGAVSIPPEVFRRMARS